MRRTNGRALVAYALVVLATAAALYLGLASSVTRTVIKRQGTPCVAVKATGRPSPGCERLARLLARTCALNPRACHVTGRTPARRPRKLSAKRQKRRGAQSPRAVGKAPTRVIHPPARRKAREGPRRGSGGHSRPSPPTPPASGGSKPPTSPQSHPPVNVTTPDLPLVGKPQVCTGIVGINC